VIKVLALGPITVANSLLDTELPRPSATGRDLLVEVRAVSVNPVDYKVVREVFDFQTH
jgi:NADPH:quinone reductase-like Zn-dependent oxidoreductase